MDFQDDFVRLVERLTRIETKLDQQLSGQLDHEVRLRAIERWKYALPIASITAVASGVLTAFNLFGK